MRLALVLVLVAALAGCGSEDAGTDDDADKRALALECITEEKDLVADGGDGFRIRFFLTADEALGEQFKGDAEGAEQIGNALLFVKPELREEDEELLADVESCLGEL